MEPVTSHGEIDSIDTDSLPPGEHSIRMIAGSHSVFTPDDEDVWLEVTGCSRIEICRPIRGSRVPIPKKVQNREPGGGVLGSSRCPSPSLLDALDQSVLFQVTERLDDIGLAATDLFPEVDCRSGRADLRQASQQDGCEIRILGGSGSRIPCGGARNWAEVGDGVGEKAQDERVGRRGAAVFESENEVVLATPNNQVGIAPGAEVAAAAEGLSRG